MGIIVRQPARPHANFGRQGPAAIPDRRIGRSGVSYTEFGRFVLDIHSPSTLHKGCYVRYIKPAGGSCRPYPWVGNGFRPGNARRAAK